MPGQASQASANASSSVLPTELTQQLQRLQPVPEQVQELQTKVQEQERVLKGLVRLMLQKGFCSPTELTTSFEPAKNPSSGSSKLSMPPVITPSHAGAPSTPFQPIRLMTSASPHEKSNVLIISRAALQKMATKNISSDLAKAVEVLKNEHKGVHGVSHLPRLSWRTARPLFRARIWPRACSALLNFWPDKMGPRKPPRRSSPEPQSMSKR